MSLFVDVNQFLQDTVLPEETVASIKKRRVELKAEKGIYSENDTLGKEILSFRFGEDASAHFHRWIFANYEIGECDG